MSFLSRLRKSVTSKTKVNNNHIVSNNNDRRNSATPSSNFSVVNQKANATVVIKSAKAVAKKQSIDKLKVDFTRKRPVNGGAVAADKNRFLHRSDTFTLKEEPSLKPDGGSTYTRADKNKFGTYSRKGNYSFFFAIIYNVGFFIK